MKLCRSVSPASRSRLPRITAFALASSAEALFGSALALVAHVIHQALAVQRRADHSGGGLEGGELRGIDGAMLPRVVEAHDARELAGDEYRHDRLGPGADALDD